MLRMLRQEIDPDSHSQTTDYEGGWRVHEECADQGGRLVVTKMTITPTTAVVPPGGINSRFLRGIQVGKMFEMFRQAILRNPSSGMEGALALFGPRKRRRGGRGTTIGSMRSWPATTSMCGPERSQP